MILVGVAKILEWRTLYHILTKFGIAFWLFMNKEKLELITDRLEEGEICEIASLFEVEIWLMGDTFRYLGFNLKPNKYKCRYWDWLL